MKKFCLALIAAFLWNCAPPVAQAANAPGYLPVVDATASSVYDIRYAINAANGMGMTEGPEGFGSKTATQDNTNTNMWMTQDTDCSQAWIQFDLGAAKQIGEMWVWNYNQSGYNNRGLKDVYIRYKTNLADSWTNLTKAGNPVFTFAMTNPNTVGRPASNLEATGNPPVSFGGVSARYIQIQPAGGQGVGIYATGANYCGLSEVRFYSPLPKAQASAASLAFPTTWVGQSSQNTLDINSLGTAALNVTGLTISGANASCFSLVSPPALPASVATGQKLTLTVKFTPTAIQAGQSANLTIATDDPSNPSIVVPLGGDSVPVTLSGFSAE